MLSVKTTSIKVARYFACELDLENKKTEVIRYGLEIIIGALIKGIVILGSAYILGIIKPVIIAIITTGIFRTFSGGYHCSTYARCLIFSILMLFIISFSSKLFSVVFSKYYIAIIIICVSLLALYVIGKWVPVDNVCKPITREKKRLRFRFFSLIYVIVWSVGILYFLYWGNRTYLVKIANTNEYALMTLDKVKEFRQKYCV